MNLQVFLHDTLKSKAPPGQKIESGMLELVMPGGSLVTDLLRSLNLPEEWVGLILVNGRQANREIKLNDKDRIDLFSPMAGG